MFFKKNKLNNLQEAPLGYWEEKSYMLVVSEEKTEDLLKDLEDKISKIKDVKVEGESFLIDGKAIGIKVVYKEEEYEVGFYLSPFSVPEVYLTKSFHFTEEEIEKIKNVHEAITIFMPFGKDAKTSYHLQIKLAAAISPNLIGVLDESAERMLPPKWVLMTASSKVTPSPSDLYTVQAVSGEKGEVWLHTHGLCRCGYTELEILESDVKNYNNHYNLISAFASYIIDKQGEFDPRKDGAYIGLLINRNPVVVTCLSWTEGLNEYKKLKLGNLADRENGHNSKTSIIFLYKSEEDENNKKVSKVTEYNDLWGENPIFFISNEETARMKELAIERFDLVKKELKNKDNHIIIKIGLPVDNDKDNLEHIWFELLEVKGNKFKAKLMQEPYNVKDMHEGDEAWYEKEDITDWLIYTKEYSVTPGNAYLLK